DGIVEAGVVVLDYADEARKLFSAWEHGHFLGYHVFHTAPGEEIGDVLLEGDPVAVHLVQDGDLLRPEVIGDLGGFVAEAAIERVGQGMSRVGAHDERAVAALRKAEGGGGGNAGLAHASLTCV